MGSGRATYTSSRFATYLIKCIPNYNIVRNEKTGTPGKSDYVSWIMFIIINAEYQVLFIDFYTFFSNIYKSYIGK